MDVFRLCGDKVLKAGSVYARASNIIPTALREGTPVDVLLTLANCLFLCIKPTTLAALAIYLPSTSKVN